MIEDSSHVNHLGIRCLLDSIFTLFDTSPYSTTTTTTIPDQSDHDHPLSVNSPSIISYPAFTEQPAYLLPLVIGCMSSYLQGKAMESDNTVRILQILVQCMKGILPDWCVSMYVIFISYNG